MKNLQKGSVTSWLIIVVVILVVAFGAYIYGQKSQSGTITGVSPVATPVQTIVNGQAKEPVDASPRNTQPVSVATGVAVSFGGNLQPSQLVTISKQIPATVSLEEGFTLKSQNGPSTLQALTFVVNTGATNPSQAVLSSLYGGVSMIVNGQTYHGVLSNGNCISKQCGPSGGSPIVSFSNLHITLPANAMVSIPMYALIPPDADGSLNHQLLELSLPNSEATISVVDSKGNHVPITFLTTHATQTTLIDGQ